MTRIVQCDKKTGIPPMRQENRDTPLYIKKYIMKIGIVSVIPHPDFCAGLLCRFLVRPFVQQPFKACQRW